MEIAVVSDIHGNSFAFKEVLEDIKNKGIKTIINLGDSLYGPLDPKGTYDLIKSNNVISISGNQDRYILKNINTQSDNSTLEFVKSQLDPEMISWLKSLSFSIEFNRDIYCCHASPQSDSQYLLESLQQNTVAIKENEEIEKILSNISQRIILCGHSHVARIVDTGTKIIINPGSVGLQAYDDEFPIFHKMETFNNLAHYSILRYTNNLLKIEQIAISYDFDKAAVIATMNNRLDWAKWIKTGRA